MVYGLHGMGALHRTWASITECTTYIHTLFILKAVENPYVILNIHSIRTLFMSSDVRQARCPIGVPPPAGRGHAPRAGGTHLRLLGAGSQGQAQVHTYVSSSVK